MKKINYIFNIKFYNSYIYQISLLYPPTYSITTSISSPVSIPIWNYKIIYTSAGVYVSRILSPSNKNLTF